jgi:hypothetical protein
MLIIFFDLKKVLEILLQTINIPSNINIFLFYLFNYFLLVINFN